MQSIKIGIINKHIDKIICPSQWIAQSAITAGVSRNLISIIYNGIDTTLFYPEQRPENKKLRILLSSVDLHNKFKGGAFALDIINKLCISTEILIIGKNGLHIGSKISTRHSVTIINQTFDSQILASHYRRADILLHTSIADNCPLTIIEAMSSGVPVIAYDAGGIPELVTHSFNGWLSKQGEIDSSVKMITHLHHNRRLLKKWKLNARQSALEKFNYSIFLNKHLELYQELANEKIVDL